MKTTLSVKNVLASLIEAIDMYNYLLKNHHRRTAIIAAQLGIEYGLESNSLSNLVLTASVHDIGALHIKERDQLLYIDAINPGPHEKMGAKMLEGFEPLKDIADIIRHHHINYSEIKNEVYKESDIPFECFFLHLADRIDVILTTLDEDENLRANVIHAVNERFDTVFHPALKESFNNLAESDYFWESIEETSFKGLLLSTFDGELHDLDDSDIDDLASVFSRIIDYKSEWTLHHSKSVSLLAENIGKLLGYDEEKCDQLRIAGYLHDIGKIAIPIEVLEKPESLDKDEYDLMKSHVKYSSLILSKTPFRGNIEKWASSHHEKRDKSGYPKHLSNRSFSNEMDIIAYADIFAALAEKRPYRDALPMEKVLEILEKFSEEKLSDEVFTTIKDNMEFLYKVNHEAQLA